MDVTEKNLRNYMEFVLIDNNDAKGYRSEGYCEEEDECDQFYEETDPLEDLNDYLANAKTAMNNMKNKYVEIYNHPSTKIVLDTTFKVAQKTAGVISSILASSIATYILPN